MRNTYWNANTGTLRNYPWMYLRSLIGCFIRGEPSNTIIFLANIPNLQYKQCMMINKRLMFIFADRHYEYLEEWQHKALLRYIR